MAIAEQQSNVVALRPSQQTSESEVDQSDLVMLKEWFQASESHHAPMRELAFRDEDYYHNYDNDQWTAAEKATHRERGQPTNTDNVIKRKINFLHGMEQRGRTDPKALPRSPMAHEKMAQVATDILVYIDDTTRLDQTTSRAALNLMVHGIEAIEIKSKKGDNQNTFIRYKDFFFDPHSEDHDFGDAQYLGYAKWFDEAVAKRMYPEGVEHVAGAMTEFGYSGGYNDTPQNLYAVNGARKRVRVIVMYYQEGEAWKVAHFTGSGILYGGPSPFTDEDGNPHCPIVAQSLYVDRNNRRYGVVRDMIGAQDRLNHLDSKIWHLGSNRRTWGIDGAFPDIDEAKDELAKVDGHLKTIGPVNQSWGFVDNTVEIQHLAAMRMNAQATITDQGPNSGLRGRGTEGQSGIAIQAQQESGMTEENSLFDGHKDWKLRVYKANWARAKQFWPANKFVRVASPESEEDNQFMQVNTPIVDVATGQPMINPQTGQPAIKNSLADMDIEIILDAVPDVVNVQIQQFEVMARLVEAGVPIPPTALIMASQLRDKEKIIKELSGGGGNPQEQAAAQQQQQQQMQIQMAQIELEMAKLKAEAEDKAASAGLKAAQTQKTMAEIPKVQAETQIGIVEARVRPMEAAHRMASTEVPIQN